MKALIIGPSWVGDMMMSQTLYRMLKAEQPDRVIDVMAPAWCRPLLSRMPEVNQALDMPLSHGALRLGERRRIGSALRGCGYEHAFVLPNSFKSALVPFFADIPQRTGWRGEMRYGLLNDLRKLNKTAFPLMVQRYAALACPADKIRQASDLPELLWPKLEVSRQEKIEAAAQFGLQGERPIIGFCPGAEFGPAKRWPHYHYATLAGELIQRGWQVVIFGSAKDELAGEQIRMTLAGKLRTWCHNLAGKTQLEQAILLLANCDAVVSNDSGLMHIAAALNKPLVALYGPTSPDFTPPLSDKARIIRLISGYHKIRKGNALEGYHQSLIDIKPERVIAELDSLLTPSAEHE
ncbi:heptosyltransferase-2 [Izhakiella capsodis]|uniref:Lipopolysaccharide heptosyltransferase 2 n=1 Tax=Izhakiella capsodis TaxID=1367852 RepID=A0A1I5AA12_9GAMM|nr:ADP-heptose--LPS heptosyltransferase RfaF [Izhakiella capsodis]SFN59276.1 heptosyltransferase-2 [Izhakiella capsodis]